MSVAVSDPTADLWRSIVFVQINYPSGAAYGGTVIKAISPRKRYIPLKLLGSGMSVDF